MLKIKMKKLEIIFLRGDAEALLREFVVLGCVMPDEPIDLSVDEELEGIVASDVVELGVYNANRDSIGALGTECTLLMTGWVPSPSESALSSVLSKYTCAWELRAPSPEEQDKAPVKLILPKITKRFYRGGGIDFSPLAADSYT